MTVELTDQTNHTMAELTAPIPKFLEIAIGSRHGDLGRVVFRLVSQVDIPLYVQIAGPKLPREWWL